MNPLAHLAQAKINVFNEESITVAVVSVKEGVLNDFVVTKVSIDGGGHAYFVKADSAIINEQHYGVSEQPAEEGDGVSHLLREPNGDHDDESNVKSVNGHVTTPDLKVATKNSSCQSGKHDCGVGPPAHSATAMLTTYTVGEPTVSEAVTNVPNFDAKAENYLVRKRGVSLLV